jgi:hypothetical protein
MTRLLLWLRHIRSDVFRPFSTFPIYKQEKIQLNPRASRLLLMG